MDHATPTHPTPQRFRAYAKQLLGTRLDPYHLVARVLVSAIATRVSENGSIKGCFCPQAPVITDVDNVAHKKRNWERTRSDGDAGDWSVYRPLL